MPPREDQISQIQNQKRKRRRKRTSEATPATGPPPQPFAKHQKPYRPSRRRKPPKFWDNRSRAPLCPRTLQEFNRRTVRPVAPKPPDRTTLREDLAKQLKRFARHGGPSLHDLREVGYVYTMQDHANSFLSTQEPAAS